MSVDIYQQSSLSRQRYQVEERVPAPAAPTTAASTSTSRNNTMSSAHLASKLSGAAASGSTRRVPLQSRNPNTIGGSYRSSANSGSGNSTEEYNSKEFNNMNRLSNLESSNNECNKGLSANSTTTNNSRNSSSTIHGGAATHHPHTSTSTVRRSVSNSEIREGSEPNIPTQARANSYTNRSSSLPSGNLDDDSVIIEEKRRKVNGGEGYTKHRYLRGRLLGKGGFAKVYLCTALDTNKAYAIKIVPKANLVKARARQKVRGR